MEHVLSPITASINFEMGLLGGSMGKESSCNAGDAGRCKFDPWVRKIPWSRT